MHKPRVSILIVHYNVYNELVDCIDSIYTSLPRVSFEIIVVDNDEKHPIQKKLLKKFNDVIYIKNKNVGFGGGNNSGAQHAKGEYLFFLNPDTIVFPKTIDMLFSFLETHKKVGVVAPLLLHEDGSVYKLQGSSKLTPLAAVVALSFINKIFPNNPISRNYFLSDWNKKELKKVDVVPGTAFMMPKKLFETVGGFDQNFFMYFEESDLCKRIQKEGFSMYINPAARIVHLGGRSSTLKKSTRRFKESRLYYFKKHYGLLVALFVEGFLYINKKTIAGAVLIGILLLFWYNIVT